MRWLCSDRKPDALQKASEQHGSNTSYAKLKVLLYCVQALFAR